jgi:ATP/maltotriose-dependent transcriptional regulator MalT
MRERTLSEALRLYDPERDRDAKYRFGADTGAAAACYLAQTKWYLGEIDHAIELIEESGRRAGESGHPPTRALIYHLRGMFEMQRGNAAAALRVSEALLELAQEHQMALYRGHGSVHASWARARLSESEARVAELAQAIAAYTDLGANLYLPCYHGLLAELEAERQNARGAVTRIDDALALSQQTGTRWIDAFLHGIRGGILLKCELTDTRPAEQAFLTAIAIAAESKEFRAACRVVSRTPLANDRPRRRGPRRARPGARRLGAHAAISRCRKRKCCSPHLPRPRT